MSYSEFLSLISNSFTIFIDGFVSISSYLITNYFFITLFGIIIFISLVYFIRDSIVDGIGYTAFVIDEKTNPKKKKKKDFAMTNEDEIIYPPLVTASREELRK